MATTAQRGRTKKKVNRGRPFVEPGDSLIWRGSVPSNIKGKKKWSEEDPFPHKVEHRVVFVPANPDKYIHQPSFNYTFKYPDKHNQVVQKLHGLLSGNRDYPAYKNHYEDESILSFGIPEDVRIVHSISVNDGRPFVIEYGYVYTVLPGLTVEIGMPFSRKKSGKKAKASGSTRKRSR